MNRSTEMQCPKRQTETSWFNFIPSLFSYSKQTPILNQPKTKKLSAGSQIFFVRNYVTFSSIKSKKINKTQQCNKVKVYIYIYIYLAYGRERERERET